MVEISTVTKWLSHLGVAVVYHSDLNVSNQYCIDTKKISLKDVEDKQQQLFALLHEAGHVILNWNTDFHQKTYPHKHHKDPEISLWLNDLLQEEYDAWQEGYELAEQLSLNINHKEYEQLAETCLNTYRGWAVTVQNFSDGIIDKDSEKFTQIVDYFSKLMK